MSKCLLLVFVATMTLCMSFMAASQDSSAFAHGWDPSEFQLGKDGPCSFELAMASTSLELRDAGESRKKVSSTFPTKTGASALIVGSVLDDIYQNPAIAHSSYFVYRNITCMRRHMGRSTPRNLAAVAQQVMVCQSKFGVVISDHLISCIQHAVTDEAR